MEAARDERPVSGFTHNHYRYPARFSPRFVAAAIETFTAPGDLVMDPFVGGGTTMVEAAVSGRNAIGVDISSLATFVSEVKTLLLTDAEVSELLWWSFAVTSAVNMHRSADRAEGWVEAGYHRNIDTRPYWRMRKAVEQAVHSTTELSERAERFARCVVLRTAQWALDARRQLPSIDGFRSGLRQNARDMIDAALEYRTAVRVWKRRPKLLCRQRSAVGLETDRTVLAMGPPRLVLTSPPYPGIHVLYHRWQVGGRKETPAPFWIANRLDGSGESYYTLGSRRTAELRSYFLGLRDVFASVVALSDHDTTFVQMVAFNEPGWQLPRYLEVAREVGLIEQGLADLDSPDGRLWRTVPNRRWHADQKGAIPASQEVVLFHKLRGNHAASPAE